MLAGRMACGLAIAMVVIYLIALETRFVIKLLATVLRLITSAAAEAGLIFGSAIAWAFVYDRKKQTGGLGWCERVWERYHGANARREAGVSESIVRSANQAGAQANVWFD